MPYRVKPLVLISMKAKRAQKIGNRKRTAKGSIPKKALNLGQMAFNDHTTPFIEKIKLP